jgi:hypothetical protein
MTTPHTKLIAGTLVIFTPLVESAIAYARAHADDTTYNHIMRSWLFSVLISRHLNAPVDQEAQALAATLHDLGWDHTGELISKYKRFEVDGAIAARNWIDAQVSKGLTTSEEWDEHRIQLVWDTIALHTTPSILAYKQPLVGLVGGIAADFQVPKSDPTGTLTWEEFERVNKEFPRDGLASGIRQALCMLIEMKPETAYGEWI